MMVGRNKLIRGNRDDVIGDAHRDTVYKAGNGIVTHAEGKYSKGKKQQKKNRRK